MELVFSEKFDRNLREAPSSIQGAFWKQANFLLKDMRHPSLRAKKYIEEENVWQARVNKDWRFYFKIFEGKYYLLKIVKHPK